MVEETKQEKLEEIEEDTSEKTEEEGETSEKREEKAAEKEPDWKAKADAMYAKYKDAKETIEELEVKLTDLEEKAKPKKEVSEDEWKKKVNFLLENKEKGYTEEEFNHIATVSKEFDVSLDEAALLEEDYIQYRREKVAKEKKVPEPGSPSLEKETLSSEEIGKLSKEEHKKLWEKELEKSEGVEGKGI